MSCRDENKNSFSEFSSFSDFLERKWINFKTRGKNFFKNMKKMRFFTFVSSCIETIQVKIFKKGTFREDIWHWFDERIEGGIGNRYFN